MTGCTAVNRNGDCLTRNAKVLCDYCDSQLSADEHELREISFLVSDMARKAQRQLAGLRTNPRACLTLRANEERTCIQRQLVALCGYCVTSMTEQQLLAYCTAIVKQRNEQREYWDDYAEATEYMEELKASGVKGIDFNLECCTDNEDYPFIVDGLFHYSRPCWVHLEADGTLSGIIEPRKPHSTGAHHAQDVPRYRGNPGAGPARHYRGSL